MMVTASAATISVRDPFLTGRVGEALGGPDTGGGPCGAPDGGPDTGGGSQGQLAPETSMEPWAYRPLHPVDARDRV